MSELSQLFEESDAERAIGAKRAAGLLPPLWPERVKNASGVAEVEDDAWAADEAAAAMDNVDLDVEFAAILGEGEDNIPLEPAAVVVPLRPAAKPESVQKAAHVRDDSDPSTIIPTTGVCARYVACHGPLTEASDESHFAVCLTLLSALVGWRAYVAYGAHREPCTLYVLLPGTSGIARKTTALRNGEQIVGRAGLDVAIQRLGHTSGKGLTELVCTSDEVEAKRREIEAPPAFLLSWDEFGSALTDDHWRGDIRAELMKLAGGRASGTQTSGSTKLHGSRVAVSLLATITNRELSAKIQSGVAHGGFLGRFLMIPERLSGRMFAIPPKATRAQLDEAAAITEWFGLLDRELGSGDLGNAYDRLSPDAQTYWTDWYETRHKRFADELEDGGDEEELAGGQFARLQALGVRVAILLALADWQPGDKITETTIERRHVAHAGRLVDICLARVLELASAGQNLRDEYVDKAKRWLRKQPGQTATWSNLCRHVRTPSGLSDKLDRHDLLGLLKRDHELDVSGAGHGCRVGLIQ